MAGITALVLIYFGEQFKTGAYLIIGAIFVILFAWRMGEEMFYIGAGALIFVLVYRTFFADEDARTNDTGEVD